MDNTAITPQNLVKLNQVPPKEISTMSEQVLEASVVMDNTNEELEDLSANLKKLSEVAENHQRITNKVKGQMREIIGKI